MTPELPLEILVHIALQDDGHVFREMLTIPLFARFTFGNHSYIRMKLTKKVRFRQGKEYLFRGKHHSIYDYPAIIYNDGCLKWFRNGHMHRGHDKPAMIGGVGVNEMRLLVAWYEHGAPKRKNNWPTKIYHNGTSLVDSR